MPREERFCPPYPHIEQQLRESHYMGAVPALLASMLGTPVHIVYQPGVSGNGHSYRLISEEANDAQLDAALEVVEGKLMYPISHSWSTHLHVGLCVEEQEYHGRDISNVLGGVASSAMTTAEDALTFEGKERRFFGPKWLDLFRLAAYTGLRIPTLYPLAAQKWHEGDVFDKANKHWGSAPFINTGSAQEFLPVDDVHIVKERPAHRKPLFIVTEQDRVFSPDGQHAIARAMGCKFLNVQAGHRWFTAKNYVLEPLLERITSDYRESVASQ
jgi:hypothetical protein